MVAPGTGANFPRLTLLAPQGAEYQAVRRGAPAAWPVLAIPMGSRALPAWWATHQPVFNHRSAVLLGLAGGLQADWAAGDGVICGRCTDHATGLTRPCDPEITQWLCERLRLPVAGSLTVPEIVTQPQAKARLGQEFACAVAEMEGYAWLGYLPRLGMVRVVSDEMGQPLPDLQAAVVPATGHIQPLPLAWAMLRQPGPALRLVSSSLTALGRLTALTQRLTANSEKNYNEIRPADVSGI